MNKHVLNNSLCLSTFIYKMLSVKDIGDLNNMIDNLKTLSFDYSNKYNDPTVGAYYLIDTNTIHIADPNNLECLYHELFHMASTKEEDGYYFCGFLFEKGGEKAFNYFNEGYTELLTNRYFKISYIGAHIVDMKLASIVENIIGQSEMESLYLRADIDGLVDLMSRYCSEDEARLLLYNIDLYNQLKKQYKLTLNDELFDNIRIIFINIQKTLLKMIYRKWKEDYNVDYNKSTLYSNECYRELTNRLLNSHISSININKLYIPVLNIEDSVNIINELIKRDLNNSNSQIKISVSLKNKNAI